MQESLSMQNDSLSYYILKHIPPPLEHSKIRRILQWSLTVLLVLTEMVLPERNYLWSVTLKHCELHATEFFCLRCFRLYWWSRQQTCIRISLWFELSENIFTALYIQCQGLRHVTFHTGRTVPCLVLHWRYSLWCPLFIWKSPKLGYF